MSHFADKFDSLKFNFKLDGRNHNVGNIGLKTNTMVIGADVSHSAKGTTENGAPSMAAVVSTISDNTSNYFASARLQSNNTEVS